MDKKRIARRRRMARDAEIWELYMVKGLSASYLATDFGLDRRHVLKIIRELNALGYKGKG